MQCLCKAYCTSAYQSNQTFSGLSDVAYTAETGLRGVGYTAESPSWLNISAKIRQHSKLHANTSNSSPQFLESVMLQWIFKKGNADNAYSDDNSLKVTPIKRIVMNFI